MPIDSLHAFAGGGAFPRPRWPWGPAAGAWRQYLKMAVLAEGCQLGPRAWCVNWLGDPQRIRLAEGVICRGLLSVEGYGEGRIGIGNGAYIGDDCLLSSARGITIGERVLLAHGVQVFDNDSHPVDLRARREDIRALLTGGARPPIASAAVRIGDDAWVGMHALILKGVTIGEGSVIAAGSVVVHDVPAHRVAAGNPARVVKSLETP